MCFEDLVNLLVRQKIWVIIEELSEYLPSMKFDSYYDDNLLPPEVGAHPPNPFLTGVRVFNMVVRVG